MDKEKLDQCKHILSKSFLFESLDADEIERLLAYTRRKKVKKKDIIFSKGDSGGQLYAILSGKVRINTLSMEGKEITLRIIEEGDFFGEIAMFDHETRSASAIMHETGELLIIEQANFKKFLEHTPKTSFTLIMALCSRLRHTTELLEDTLFLSLPVRLAKKVMDLSDKHGQPKDGGIFINLKLSQTELGHCVNSSRESINKLLREWSHAGIIDFEKGYMTVNNFSMLEDIEADEGEM